MKTARATKRRPHPQFERRPSGVMGTALTCLGLFVVLVTAHYMVNIGHLMMVRQDLQSAVDAAALAGASSLNDTPDAVESAALSLAADNYADGLPVSSQSRGMQITATAIPGDNIIPGCVKVVATREVQFFGGAFCGLPDTTNVTTVAMAGTAGSAATVNEDQLFPMAVSADVVPMDHTLARSPLTIHHLGDQITLFTNGQRTRNTTFTTFARSSKDTGYLKAAIDQALKPDVENRGVIPQLSVGDTINLSNGTSGTRFMAEGNDAGALMRHPLLTVPLIVGDPQQSDTATVVGFATFKVIGVVLSPNRQEIESLSVTLVKGMVHGISKPLPTTHNVAVDRAIGELSAGIPKLVSLDYMDRKPWLEHTDIAIEEPARDQSKLLSFDNNQPAFHLPEAVAPVETSQAPSITSGASAAVSDTTNNDWQEISLGALDIKAKPWLVDVWLSVLLSIPIAIAIIHAFTRQAVYAKSYKRETRQANTTSPYVRRWKKSGRILARF